MENLYELTDTITLDLDRILTIAAVRDGIRITYIDRVEEVIAPLTLTARDRFFDHWLNIGEVDGQEPSAAMKAVG